MASLFARLSEPSTHAGFAALFQVLKAFLPEYAAILDWLSGGFALVAVGTPEKKV